MKLVPADFALPINASLFVIFARILANAPPHRKSLRTSSFCATRAHSHFCISSNSSLALWNDNSFFLSPPEVGLDLVTNRKDAI